MADEFSTEGATTVPPPPPKTTEAVPLAAPLRKPAAASQPAAVKRGSVRDPKKNDPSGPRRPVAWWARQALPLAGLALMLGCLYCLLNNLPSALPPGTGSPGSALRRFSDPGVIAVVIDPGHGGIDTGAIALGLQEKALNLDVALRVTRVLESKGLHVRMTRTIDQAVSLEDRVRLANGTPGAIFVSIHFNDALTGERGQSYRASGVETYYSEHKQAGGASDWLWTSLFGGRGSSGPRDSLAWSAQEGAQLADSIQGALVNATSAADRGTKERSLYVTRRVRGPAVLVEGGFISHPAEAKLLGEAGYRQKLAEAIAAGIMRYLETAGRPASAHGAPSGVGA